MLAKRQSDGPRKARNLVKNPDILQTGPDRRWIAPTRWLHRPASL